MPGGSVGTVRNLFLVWQEAHMATFNELLEHYAQLRAQIFAEIGDDFLIEPEVFLNLRDPLQ
jgi:hypothetical protein